MSDPTDQAPPLRSVAGARGWLFAIGLLIFGLAMLAPFLISGASGSPRLVRVSGPTMGTAYAVTVVATPNGPSANGLDQRIAKRLALVNQQMSTYDPESELSRFNASGSIEWQAVSDETAAIVGYALELAEQSGGAFDPTIGPLVNLWGFGPDASRFKPPAEDAIVAARTRVGYGRVHIRTDPPALRKEVPEIYLDLSAVAKGYGVDAIAELLEAEGFKNYLVEIGGEVRARGAKPTAPWRVGIEKADAPLPGVEGTRLQRVVELKDRALATSGDYRNFFEHEGIRYSHTIDPTTGQPVHHDLATVTVLATTCREADALATTLLVLGPTAGYDWATERDLAALLIRRTPAGELIERATPTWKSEVLAEAP
ncbi:FAD:protein FMN transferase [Botrimarina hoheduenensis]|uniref:FAD:protein FMN transferase n=1 Tax=Botrimarina hoheduenensis TaxID=2528000 RepID=A0A5C5VPT2_9BACT|nr:FAD:protein FMN transferase [Botrimarina hoheduenensis]TWT40157.1 Thiamine biosynthesis lipoprotein ApbE precursor [Botrimarina hoheduenensis]